MPYSEDTVAIVTTILVQASSPRGRNTCNIIHEYWCELCVSARVTWTFDYFVGYSVSKIYGF